jgi:hypothetical protein
MAAADNASLEIQRAMWEKQANSERDAREVDAALGSVLASQHLAERLALTTKSKEAALVAEKTVLEADVTTCGGRLPRMTRTLGRGMLRSAPAPLRLAA